MPTNVVASKEAQKKKFILNSALNEFPDIHQLQKITEPSNHRQQTKKRGRSRFPKFRKETKRSYSQERPNQFKLPKAEAFEVMGDIIPAFDKFNHDKKQGFRFSRLTVYSIFYGPIFEVKLPFDGVLRRF